MRLSAAVLLLGLLAAGCGKDDPVRPGGSATAEQRAWIGTFAAGPDHGSVVLDLVRNGSALAGEIVLGAPGPAHLWVTGTMRADSMFLGLDPAHSPNSAGLSVLVRVLPNGDLSASMEYVPAGFDAELTCRALPWRELVAEATYPLATTVVAMAHDGSHLWLSTPDHYLLMNSSGAIDDTVLVGHEPAVRWTSTELMFDGDRMWGMYPITVLGPGGASNVADLLAFDRNGRRPDSLRVGHRPSGLAYDGTHIWSLRTEPSAMLRLDGTGAVADSVPLEVPDAFELGFDGTHFWTLGWFLERLYQVDANGRVTAICEPPRASAGGVPVAIAVEGSRIWCVEHAAGANTLRRLTVH